MEAHIELAKQLTINLINKMFGEDFFSVDFEMLDESTMKINISGSSVNFLIGQHGKNLIALQSIIRQMYVNNSSDFDEKLKLILDIDGYKEKRLEKLKAFADTSIEKMRSIKGEVTLPVMSSYERFIIHDYIAQEYPDVSSSSIGEEPNRRIVVSPKEL